MASSYPSTLDSFVTNRTDATPLSGTHAAEHDDINDAINKIEAELGINPKGGYSSVAQSLSVILLSTQTANYTLALADANTVVEINKATAATVTIPPNSSVAFPVGTVIGVDQIGAGQVTFVAGAGVTIRSSSGYLKLEGQYSGASLRKRATDEWVLIGDLTNVGPTSTSVAEISLASHGTPATRTSHFIKVKARTTTGSTGRIRAALYEGSTNRSGDLESSLLTNSLATYSLAIPDAAAAAITDYSNLSIRVWGYDAAGNALVFEIAQLNLSLPAVAAGGTKSTAVAEISLASHATPSSRTNHTIRVRARTTTGSTGTIKAALYEGATNRSGDLQTSTLTNSLADYVLTIPDASAAAITSYANLSIRLWGYDSAGNALVFEVAKLSLRLPA